MLLSLLFATFVRTEAIVAPVTRACVTRSPAGIVAKVSGERERERRKNVISAVIVTHRVIPSVGSHARNRTNPPGEREHGIGRNEAADSSRSSPRRHRGAEKSQPGELAISRSGVSAVTMSLCGSVRYCTVRTTTTRTSYDCTTEADSTGVKTRKWIDVV